MAKLTDKLFNRVIEGKLVADSGDELPKELPAVSAVDNGKALVVSGGKWQKGTISGGTQLYKHIISTATNDPIMPDEYNLTLLSTYSSFASVSALATAFGEGKVILLNGKKVVEDVNDGLELISYLPLPNPVLLAIFNYDQTLGYISFSDLGTLTSDSSNPL